MATTSTSQNRPVVRMSMLATGIAEVSAQPQWKTSQLPNFSLSYPELIRRGTANEQQLRQHPSNDHRTRYGEWARTMISFGPFLSLSFMIIYN
jgi:hypothetical protein